MVQRRARLWPTSTPAFVAAGRCAGSRLRSGSPLSPDQPRVDIVYASKRRISRVYSRRGWGARLARPLAWRASARGVLQIDERGISEAGADREHRQDTIEAWRGVLVRQRMEGNISKAPFATVVPRLTTQIIVPLRQPRFLVMGRLQIGSEATLQRRTKVWRTSAVDTYRVCAVGGKS
jgi:hypothetical protein